MIRLKLAGSYPLRWEGIEYTLNGQKVDVRTVCTVAFQLIPVGATAYGTWTAGTWEAVAPANGPYVATITIGAGQPAPVSPTQPGVYRVVGQITGPGGQNAIFDVAQVDIEAP